MTAKTIITEIAKEIKSAHPELNGRVERAVEIAQTPGAIRRFWWGGWQVASQSNGGAYTVDAGGFCTCPDCQKPWKAGYTPKPWSCKHGLAAYLVCRGEV